LCGHVPIPYFIAENDEINDADQNSAPINAFYAVANPSWDKSRATSMLRRSVMSRPACRAKLQVALGPIAEGALPR
jgi:hypothetical protein